MKIIPVMDVLKQQVVHAIRGVRANYTPIKSLISKSSRPLEVAKSFSGLGFSSLYLADLDAIQGRPPDLPLYSRLQHETHLHLMLDAGVTEMKTIASLTAAGIPQIIIGTETLNDMKFVKQVTEEYSPEQFIVSVDLQGDTILSKDRTLRRLAPLEAVSEFTCHGIETFIILDLSRVGSEQGARTDLIRAIRQSSVQVITGGGVKSPGDLEALKAAGAAGVLVATALHKGTLSVASLSRYEL